MALVRCFLQEADTEFTRDTIESLSSARSLYATALELCNTPEFLQEPDEGEALPFDILRNPVLDTLKAHAETNLFKLHIGRNIAGEERELSIGLKPTPFRFSVLIDRAKQLAGLAQQIEAAFLASLEKLEAEQLNLLNAKNDLEMSKASIRLQDLRVKEALDGVKLAELQKQRTQIQRDHYQKLLEEGLLESEKKTIEGIKESRDFELVAGVAQLAISVYTLNVGGLFSSLSSLGDIMSNPTKADNSMYAASASYERRKQEWEFQLNIADQNIQIGDQQIRLSDDRMKIVGQERNIAFLRSGHSDAVLNFLANKFLNVELYDWMSDVLEGVYSFFLQQATATAQLAAKQLAFERQEPVPSLILADYWEPPESGQNGLTSDGTSTDRRGLTGSARLLQDLHQLDQIAFQTDRHKLQLTKTISLSQLSPAEFQLFRETGILRFSTPMELFDRDFPGHYLRMIKRVRISVIALTSPIEGIHANLTTNGVSKVVLTNGYSFSRTEIRRPPESVALSTPINATGLFELQPVDQTKLLPFESMGVDTFWELEMPKPSNFFNFKTIADVLLTIEYTALNSPDYRRQVIQKLDRKFSADRAFSFRQEFVDQWYDLNHPELVREEDRMKVRFATRREDFPANLEDLKIREVVLYFSLKQGKERQVQVRHLKFHPADAGPGGLFLGEDDQNLYSVNGIISTRTGAFDDWDSFRLKSPIGEWELAFHNDDDVRLFTEEVIEDILFVITYEGVTPEWPV